MAYGDESDWQWCHYSMTTYQEKGICLKNGNLRPTGTDKLGD